MRRRGYSDDILVMARPYRCGSEDGIQMFPKACPPPPHTHTQTQTHTHTQKIKPGGKVKTSHHECPVSQIKQSYGMKGGWGGWGGKNEIIKESSH